MLLDAALTVIRREGPSASMELMAAEAGVTKPILYRYFGDREGLIAGVAARFADHLVERLEKGFLEAGDDGPAKVRVAVETYVRVIEDELPLYTYFIQHSPAGSEVTVGLVHRIAVPVAIALGDYLRSIGADSGPAELWAHGLIGMVHMAGSRWMANPVVSRDRMVRYLESLILFGVVNGMMAPAEQES